MGPGDILVLGVLGMGVLPGEEGRRFLGVRVLT